MTTAARPTFDTARGGSSRGEKSLSSLSKQYSARDLPSHTKLKYRQGGQGTSDELASRDFREELEERERLLGKGDIRKSKRELEEASKSSSVVDDKKRRLAIESGRGPGLSTEDDVSDTENNKDSDSDSDSDESEDDTAELLAELNRIKRERAAEEAKKEAEKKQADEKIRMDLILSGNPLMAASGPSDFKVKRRWDDYVVFKNCAKGEPDRSGKVFINDTLRSQFHKKFMEKYIK